MVDKLFDGYYQTVFAYGQTGSGKLSQWAGNIVLKKVYSTKILLFYKKSKTVFFSKFPENFLAVSKIAKLFINIHP